MNLEVRSIITLVFPRNERKEYEFDVPLTIDQLPDELWKETDDHVAGVYKRQNNSRKYELSERMTRDEAAARGIMVF